MKSKIREYSSEDINVTYDVKRCIHAEECVRNLRSVFNPKERVWIQPENASADAIASTVTLCPTGALHYNYKRTDGGAAEVPAGRNTVHLDANGPLYLRGQIVLQDADGAVLLEDTRMALCRCGASENKPLCDNRHLNINFAASNTFPRHKSVDTATPELNGNGKLVVEPTTNGPLHVTGNFEILGPDGSVLYRGDDAWLCRCGGSSKKPFCDSTHRQNGFVG